MLRLPRKMTMDTSKVLRLPRKLQDIFWKRRKSIAPATQKGFRHVTKHLWMSRSATPATRNEATRRLKPPKMTPPAELTIGKAIRGSRERLRTVADGCERLRTWTQRRANTPSTPRPPEWNGNPCYAFGKNTRNYTTNYKIKFFYILIYPTKTKQTNHLQIIPVVAFWSSICEGTRCCLCSYLAAYSGAVRAAEVAICTMVATSWEMVVYIEVVFEDGYDTHTHTHLTHDIHTYTHTHIHTDTHTYVRTYIHTYTRTYIHTHIHNHTYIIIHT